MTDTIETVVARKIQSIDHVKRFLRARIKLEKGRSSQKFRKSATSVLTYIALVF